MIPEMDPAAVRLAGCGPARLSPGSLSMAAALLELGRVHALEAARLLRAAARLAARPERMRAREVAGWRARAREEILLSRADGFAVPRLLDECVRLPARAWPSSIALARAALRLAPGDEGRIALARAEIEAGRPRDAAGRLERLLRGGADERSVAPAMTALAVALLALGDDNGALALAEAAARRPRSGLEPLVGGLALALRCGDAGRARAAGERLARLDLAIPGSRRRFDGALRRWKERLDPRPARGGARHRARARRLALEMVRSPSPAPAAVARSFLG